MQIVSGSYDNSVWLWDASIGMELKELKGCTSLVNLVIFLSNSMQIVSGSNDDSESVQVWDASTHVELNELKGHTSLVLGLLPTFSSDRTQIVPGSSDDSVQKYNLVNSVWNLADMNWIISSPGKDCLMWVPPAAQVTEPSNILVISHHGFGSVDFQQSMIGVEWVGCYTPLFKV